MNPIFYPRISQAAALLFLLLLPFSLVGQPPLLDAVSHPKFQEPLPVPAVLDATAGGDFTIQMRQGTQWLGLRAPNGAQLYTTIFGYGLGNNATYPGPTILAKSNVPVEITWKNKLQGGHILPIDYSLHMASPPSGIPTVAHLHGGHTESASDGLPEAWFTYNDQYVGPHYVKKKYYYGNTQEAATLWYHDHALGITRLNVYAGLAGFYLLTDNNEQSLQNANVLPSGTFDREIVIQDRQFLYNGALYMPFFGETDFEDCPNAPSPPMLPIPSILPEFFGDFILVNGMTWPYLDVEPRPYRLRLLNGSDSRTYVLQFSNFMPFTVVGTDDGLLENATNVSVLIIAPGERYDVVVDFSAVPANTNVILQNFGPDAPWKGANYNYDPTRPTAKIMQFRATLPLSGTPATVMNGTSLAGPYPTLTQTGATRKLALFEGRDEYCRLRPILGTVDDGSLLWDEPITENPGLGDTEVWEIYNATEDAHPIHLHLVSFKILGWYNFTADLVYDGADGMTGGSKHRLQNVVVDYNSFTPPTAVTSGPKDTGVVPPGKMMRVIANFDMPGRYVWHCHILSHEDHEMMRPFYVGPISVPMVAQEGPRLENEERGDVAYGNLELEQNHPNPFEDATTIVFNLPEDSSVRLEIFNMQGESIGYLANGLFPKGEHQMFWDGKDRNGNLLPTGIYIYRLQVNDQILTKQLNLIR